MEKYLAIKAIRRSCLYMRFLIVFGFCVLSNATIFAAGEEFPSVEQQNQGKTVTGKITDSNGQALVGVTVSVEGTSIGVITDATGNYSITVPSESSILVFSFIGYVTEKVPVAGKSNISFVLIEDVFEMSEVVVTALGMSRDKKALGYAMTEIKGDEIARVNSVNPTSGLLGKVAGVQINTGNSGPQSANRIIIRGNTSLGLNSQPIFVVDGVIIDNSITASTEWGSQQDFGNELKNLNADDFESVSVLKGAAATALYGSRAANGVVLITTKKGKKGEGIGVSVSHSMSWDQVYKFPDIQHRFGPGNTTAWGLNGDGSINRSTTETLNFGPEFDGLPYTRSGKEYYYSDKKDNIDQMYQTGKYANTNVALSGGNEKSTFRLSYSNLSSNGTTFNNEYDRSSISLNTTYDISKVLKAEAGVSYVSSNVKNPTYQGGGRSPIYDFMYQVPRDYDTKYWLKNYKSAKGDGYNSEDPYSYTQTIWEYLENNYTQDEGNFRGNVKFDFAFTNWLNLKLMGDMYKLHTTQERKILATGSENYNGSEYQVLDKNKDQYKITAMLNAHKQFGNYGLNGSVAVEQWDTRSSYYNAYSQGGLRNPGVFDMTNSIKQARVDTRMDTDRKRINSLYAFVNFDWKGQVFVDVTGRNDWSSSLIYTDGTGNVSYFYPSVSSSWILTETLRESLPEAISFAKIRGSYAIVGNDTDPYLTSIGYYKINPDRNTYTNPLDGNEYPNYVFDSNALRNLDLKPEKQHSVELGAEMKFFKNRLGFDFAWYKTNTKNQILALSQANETGLSSRWINAGNIQNSGVELVISGTPIMENDWRWDVSLNLTHNENKIVALTKGVETYTIEGASMDLAAYATVGGSYGDIYTSYAYKRNDKGEKILNASGAWQRLGTPKKVGSLQPDLLGGFTSTLTYKNFSLGTIIDARFGGDIASKTYNYGRYSGTLKSSLYGRTEALGGLPRTLSDGRVVHDGMIPDGVFADGTVIGGTNVSGMSYQEAYEDGLVAPVSAYNYYNNMHSWGTGIREEAILECSWVALREVSLRMDVPKRWLGKLPVQSMNVGLVARNLGYLYNSLPDNIHPEGLSSNRSAEFLEGGGAAYTRSFGFNLNVAF